VARRIHITVHLGLRTHYGRQVLLGLSRYGPRQAQWDIFVATAFLGPDRLQGERRTSGVIAAIITSRLKQELLKAGVPVVNVSAKHQIGQIPTVVSDDRMAGRMAAEHFLARGFRNLAYCGHSGFSFSRLRGDGFAEAAQQAGAACHHYERPYGRIGKRWARWCEHMGAWLRSLMKPVGLMAFTDAHAYRIQRICHDIGLTIPEEIALVGVNNDDLLVPLCQPCLSSIELNAVKIGYEAAALLDRLMHGQRPPKSPILIPPVGVVVRGSSDIEAIDDPEMANALRFIRERAADGIEVEDVLDELTISRRTLERRFRDCLCRSPHDEIMRVKLEQAKRLLAETRATVAEVTERSGFGSLKHFHKVFKQRTGVTPAKFRNQYH